jgi:hypothetical protein
MLGALAWVTVHKKFGNGQLNCVACVIVHSKTFYEKSKGNQVFILRQG